MDSYVPMKKSKEEHSKMKKISALILTLIMLWVMTLPALASPLEAFYTADINLNNPGNPRADKPEYSYSWLDNILVRSDPSAVTSAAYTPVPDDYRSEDTYEEFVNEVNNYSLLFKLDEKTVGDAYHEVSSLIYYAVTAMGFTADYQTMCDYIQSQGIALSRNNAVDNAMSVAVVYAALRYNAVYVLYEKNVEIPVGTTVDQALIAILAALVGVTLPSGIDSYSGFGVLTIKNYIEGFEDLPVSENPEADEVFHWAKVITASENGYQVPMSAFDEATRAQREYVDYLYYASIINTLYDIYVDPVYLVLAMQSSEDNALQRFILKSMLDEKQIAYTADMTCEQLFDLACRNGYFALEDEFYTDIFKYELTVPASCDKIWFTPFALSSQLEGGNDAYLRLFLNGTEMKPNSTVSVALDTAKAQETVEIKSVYDDGENPKEETVYSFRVIKSTALDEKREPVAENDMVGQVEQFIGTIIPDSNTVGNEKVDQIFNSIDNAVSQAASDLAANLLTTYAADEATTYKLESTTYPASTTAPATTSGERFDFNYLEQLIDGMYVTDANGNIVTTQSLFGNEDAEDESFIEKAVQTVKESPEVVAVPSSLLAAFGFVGYFTTKKHRDGAFVGMEAETDEETEE